MDICGKLIRRADNGTTVEHGWEIDQITPVSLGGSDELSNLQALYWENTFTRAMTTRSGAASCRGEGGETSGQAEVSYSARCGTAGAGCVVVCGQAEVSYSTLRTKPPIYNVVTPENLKKS